MINPLSSRQGADQIRVLFFLGEIMKKAEKNQMKDRNKNIGKIWIDEHTPYEKRTTGSGLMFGGRYVNERK